MELGAAAFDLDGKPVTMGMVLAVGMISGRLVPAVEALRDAMSAEALLEATGGDLTGQQLTPRVNQWRNEHGLSSAELTQNWLAAHGLEVGDLAGYVSRIMSREIVGDRIGEARAANPAPLGDAMKMLLDHLLFDDALEGQVLDVAMRAAVDPPAKPGPVEKEKREVLADLEEKGGAGVLGLLFALDPAQIDRVIAIESVFRVGDRSVCSAEAIATEIKKNARGLTQIEYAVATFPQEDVALEVIATIREDSQMWLERIAHQVEVVPARAQKYVDDLTDGVISTKLATGQTGEVIGPQKVADGYRVYEVLGRKPPAGDDPVILQRIQERLRRRAYASAVERRVRFRMGLE